MILNKNALETTQQWIDKYSECFKYIHAIEIALKEIIEISNTDIDKTDNYVDNVYRKHRLHSLLTKLLGEKTRRWIIMCFPDIKKLLKEIEKKEIYFKARGYLSKKDLVVGYDQDIENFCNKYSERIKNFVDFLVNVIGNVLLGHCNREVLLVCYVYSRLKQEFKDYQKVSIVFSYNKPSVLEVISTNEGLIDSIHSFLNKTIGEAKRNLGIRNWLPIKKEEYVEDMITRYKLILRTNLSNT